MSGESLTVSCRCGNVVGAIAPANSKRVHRVVCYCDDCQAFANWLRDDLLDEHGGSDICQISPSQLRFSAGTEHLACARLSEKGLLRWYASCCRTPLGNIVPTPQSPFVGVPSAALPDHARVDRVVGPPRHRGMAQHAVGEGRPEGAHPTWPKGMLVRTFGRMFRDRLLGRHMPTPFFDAAGEPVVAPRSIR